MNIAEVNLYYANLYSMVALLAISSSFLLWVGMRATSVLVERETDSVIAKVLAIILGLAVSAQFIFVGMQFSFQIENHAYTLKQLGSEGAKLSPTQMAFIERIGVGDAVPEPSLFSNPITLIIGLVALAFCILPFFIPAKSSDA